MRKGQVSAILLVMKATVGIDAELRYESALTLLGRLKFADLHLDLLHVFQPLSAAVTAEISGPEPGGYVPAEALDHMEEANRARGEAILEQALAKAKKLELHPTGTLMLGFPAQQILSYADETHSDLVCVTAHRHGAFECFVLGSVCRALVIAAKQSILIAKGNPEDTGDLKVVVATDHSSYSNRCMEKLFRLAPAGLGEVTVLSVVEPDMFIPVSPEAAKVMVEEEQKHWDEVKCKTEQLCRRFQELGATTHSKVLMDDPKTQIAETMHETGADLLIMGAQGHGFLERIAAGSVSLQQVVAENYPVLIIRI